MEYEQNAWKMEIWKMAVPLTQLGNKTFFDMLTGVMRLSES